MRDLDNLTPLDARNSLLMDPQEYSKRGSVRHSRGYESVPLTEQPTAYGGARQFSDAPQQHLLTDAASIGGRSHSHTRSISGERSQSPPGFRAPRLPEVDLGAPNQDGYGYGGPPQQGYYRGHAY
jgi:hypothetical protein